MKRSLTIAIVLFWCLMNILLFRRQLWAPPPPIPIQTVAAITEPMEEWWGVYYQGEKIGYGTQKITPGPQGYHVQDSSLLKLNLLGTVQTLRTRLEMTATQDWLLREFDFELQSDQVGFKARGKIEGTSLYLEVQSGGHLSKRTLSLSQPPYLLAALKPYVVTQNFEPGTEQLFPIFDPSTLSQQIATFTVEGREKIKIGDRVEPVLRIRQKFKGITVVSWVDGKGKTLKEETPTGLSLIQQSAEEATTLPRTRSISLDLITQTAVRPQTPIAAPTQKKLLKLKLSGVNLGSFILTGDRQRLSANLLEIQREDLTQVVSYQIPLRDQRFASYLQSTPFLQSDHPEIQQLAQKVIKSETDAVKASLRIREWVYENLAKEPTVSIPNALEVLRTKRGDCNEHAVLFNALVRAAGIPAKTVVGLVYLRGAFYYHAWSEIWLGRWISVDPVLNQFPADVTHVKFLEGEIDRQIDILQLIGNLKIEVVETG
ncbi:MAG TPA: transglutaminase domain-containing protein [Candidatus Binatia bacterium]|nr:transglutaminase domain-containing protein [Candidatus Binatia bacterium]